MRGEAAGLSAASPWAACLGVVIPALNAAGTIRATLESLRPFRAAGAEIVVVDGGSTDETCNIAREHAVQVVTSAGGMYAAINVGCRSVMSRWLTWINADDTLFPHAISERIDRAGECAVLYGRVDFLDGRGHFLHSWKSARASDLLKLYRAGYSPLLQQGTIFRRDVFEQLGGFDESYRYVGDADFWWRALEHGFMFQRDDGPPVAGFRLHDGQLSRRFAEDMGGEHRRMVARHGCSPGMLSALVAALRFRAANWRGYVVRSLRRADLGGGAFLPGSYDKPAVRAPTSVM